MTKPALQEHGPTELRLLGATLFGLYLPAMHKCHDPEQVVHVRGGLDGFYGIFGVTDGYCPRLDGFTDHRPYLLTPATMNLVPCPGCTRIGGPGRMCARAIRFLDHAGHGPFPMFVISVVILRIPCAWRPPISPGSSSPAMARSKRFIGRPGGI